MRSAAPGRGSSTPASEGCLPLSIEGGSLASGTITVDASRSSQFFSALLLAALAVDGGLAVRAAGAVASAPYVGMTVQTLRDLGHDVTEDGGVIRVRRGSALASRYDVPGDYSSAVPLLAAVTAVGGRIRLTGLRWPSADADARALPVLESMGLALAGSKDGIEASAPGRAPRPVSVRASEFPDAVPALAAVAALAEGRSRFDGVGHLRLKESDRLGALAEILTSAGADTVAEGDALVVAGPAAPEARIVGAAADASGSPYGHGGRDPRPETPFAPRRESRVRVEVVPVFLSGSRAAPR